jgi:hypothetical protein
MYAQRLKERDHMQNECEATPARPGLAARGPWIVLSSLILALLVAPFAMGAGEGKPLNVGKRNPARGAAVRTTQLVAKTKVGVFAAKFTNAKAGGSLLATCRAAEAPDQSSAAVTCLRASNSGSGEAFQFQGASGAILGVIQSGASLAVPNPGAVPFVTNATGEAIGLNADKVDGMDATEIIAAAQAQNPASSAPSFAFARAAGNGTIDQSRSQGVTQTNVVHTQPGIYCFVGLTSRPKNAAANIDGAPGEIAVDTTTGNPGADCNNQNNVQLIVRTYRSDGTPENKGFYVNLTGTTGG